MFRKVWRGFGFRVFSLMLLFLLIMSFGRSFYEVESLTLYGFLKYFSELDIFDTFLIDLRSAFDGIKLVSWDTVFSGWNFSNFFEKFGEMFNAIGLTFKGIIDMLISFVNLIVNSVVKAFDTLFYLFGLN